MAGPLALVGSGEYTGAMLEVERSLIEGRPPRYVQIPTAAAREGAARLAYWVELGARQAQRLAVEAVPLVVTDRTQADDPAIADQVSGAGLVYLSGGNPALLADTLRDTLLWRAIEAAWQAGTALAGCSAGAMALGGWVPDLRNPAGRGRRGLGVVPRVQVLPHFDMFVGRMPDALIRVMLRAPAGIRSVGIDEDTALVGDGERFTVRGRQSAWLLDGTHRQRLPIGSEVTFPLAETV
jgi:cyanophycinase